MLDNKTAALIAELKAYRKKLGWSQEIMAREIGCSIFSLAMWERQRRQPRGSTRVLIERWLRHHQSERGNEHARS